MEPEAPLDATDASPLKQIRTYQGDVAEAISHEKASLVSIRAAEKAKQDILNKSIPVEDAPTGKKRLVSLLLFIISIILLGAAGYAAWYTYGTYKTKTAVPVVLVPENRLLPVISTDSVDVSTLTRDALISLTASERTKALSAGAVEHIDLLKTQATATALGTPLDTTNLFIILNATPPGSLVRALDPLFMLGTLGQSATAGGNQTFILVKLDSFENAYAGMLDWEPSMEKDVLPLFTAPNASSTPGTFKDVTLKNKDARELVDASGTPELIYSFYNQKLLILTGSEAALSTITAELDAQASAK